MATGRGTAQAAAEQWLARRARRWLWKAAAPLAIPVAAALTLLILPLAVIAGADAASSAGSGVRCSFAGTGTTIAGVDLDAAQMGHAQTITTVAASAGLESYAATVALATAWQESRLRMLANDGSSPRLTREQAAVTATSLGYPNDGVGSDFDSVNTFQQRWIAGWGTVAQLMDPVYAARAFYDRLITVPNWATIPLTRAAQAVQVSADGDAYARWGPFASELTGLLWPTAEAIAADPGGPSGGVCPGLAVPAGSWTGPTEGLVTSGFGSRWGALHAGVDVAGRRNAPVYAAADGTVTTAACTSAFCDRDGGLDVPGYGNLVEIDHGGGLATRYAHLSGYTVTAGQSVPAGALIGYQGSTGDSTGVHLHYETRVDGASVDPVPFMAARGVDLSADTVGPRR